MKAKELIKKYPELWATIEASVWDDCMYQFKIRKGGENLHLKERKAISYNAAFVACLEYHKMVSKYKDALIWMSGSEDFSFEGKARKGFEKIVKPLLIG